MTSRHQSCPGTVSRSTPHFGRGREVPALPPAPQLPLSRTQSRQRRCIVGLVGRDWVGWVGGRGHSSHSGAIFGVPAGLACAARALRPAPGLMAPRPLSPLVLALGGAAAVLGSVLFILWKTYFGRGRQRRWDRGEGWWGAEPARFPEWDEWEVSVGPGPAPPRERPRGGQRPCARGTLLVPGLGVPTSRPS